MTRPPEGAERPLALGLAVAVERAMEAGAPPPAIRAAREAAAILGLDALDHLLGDFEPHRGGPWPAELEPVRDRLLRTAARAREEGTLAPFREASADWAALAAELEAIEWTAMPARAGEVATLALPVALGELPYETDDAAVRRVRLAAPVAASLRAALDWLAGTRGFPRPVRLRTEESLLEASLEGLDPSGLDAAQRVIAAMDGSLGPHPRAGESGWILRVPVVAPRDHFLMLEQGRLRFAIPWHSVLRLQSVAVKELTERARALGMPVLEPLAPLATAPHERPVITVAHGLRRGWVVADRVIWRLAAEPCGADPAAAALGLDEAVRTDEGDVFAVASARRLLGATPVPEITLPPRPDREEGIMPHASEAAGERRDSTPAGPVTGTEPRETEARDARIELPWWLEGKAPPREEASSGRPVAVLDAAEVEKAGKASSFTPAPVSPESAAPLWEPVMLTAAEVTPVVAPEFVAETLPPAPEPTGTAEVPERDRELTPADVQPAGPSPALEAGPESAFALESAAGDARAAQPESTPEPAVRESAPVSEPAPERDSATTPAAPAPESGTLVALVVEDAIAARAFLARALGQRGFEVVLAERAAELDPLLESRPWSLVLLDVTLPDASGAEMLRAAAARLARLEAPPPLVALVRDADDAAAAVAAGLDDVLEKPVSEGDLVRLIERLAAARRLSA